MISIGIVLIREQIVELWAFLRAICTRPVRIMDIDRILLQNHIVQRFSLLHLHLMMLILILILVIIWWSYKSSFRATEGRAEV